MVQMSMSIDFLCCLRFVNLQSLRIFEIKSNNKEYYNKIMTSAPSDSESNVTGFIHYSDKNFKYLYKSMIQNMEKINQDLLLVEKNMKNIVSQAGPLESQLNTLLQTLPKPNLTLPMETD